MRLSEVHLSPAAVTAALVSIAPPIVESFVPSPFAPALEVAGVLATAAIATHATLRAANVTTWRQGCVLMRDVLPHAPKREGGSALAVLRLAFGVEGVRAAVGAAVVRKLPKLLGALVMRSARACVPGASIVLQSARAVSDGLDAMALVTTLEALGRRSADLAEARAALGVVNLPGVSQPTVRVAA